MELEQLSIPWPADVRQIAEEQLVGYPGPGSPIQRRSVVCDCGHGARAHNFAGRCEAKTGTRSCRCPRFRG